MESVPQTVWSEAQQSVVLDSFGSWEFSFLDLIHKLPRAFALVCDFLNLAIEERPLSFSGSRLEGLPGFTTSRCSVVVQSYAT